MTEHRSLDERADDLDEKLKENSIDESISILVRDAKRRRRQIIALTISLVLDILLTIGLASLAIQARDASVAIQKSQNSIVAGCKVGNDFRQTESNLWTHILSIQPIYQTLTPAQQAQRDKVVSDFQTYLKTTFAPRDCSNVIQK